MTRYIKIEEAAKYLNLSYSRMRFEVFKKRIPFIKVGRSIRFEKEQLDAWMESFRFNPDEEEKSPSKSQKKNQG